MNYPRKDYRARKPGIQKLRIFLFGFLFGVLLAVPATHYLWPAATVKSEAAAGLPETQHPDSQGIADLTFYDILTADEALVFANQPGGGNAKAGSIKPLYLQLGAFQSGADADNLKAQVALIGLSAMIESVEIPKKGGRWFRVRLGPVMNEEELARLKDQLNRNNIIFAEVGRK